MLMGHEKRQECWRKVYCITIIARGVLSFQSESYLSKEHQCICLGKATDRKVLLSSVFFPSWSRYTSSVAIHRKSQHNKPSFKVNGPSLNHFLHCRPLKTRLHLYRILRTNLMICSPSSNHLVLCRQGKCDASKQ